MSLKIISLAGNMYVSSLIGIISYAGTFQKPFANIQKAANFTITVDSVFTMCGSFTAVINNNHILNFTNSRMKVAIIQFKGSIFELEDNSLVNEQLFYQLKVQDKDRSAKYIHLIAINNKLSIISSLLIFSYPATNYVTVTDHIAEEDSQLSIYYMNEKKLVI